MVDELKKIIKGEIVSDADALEKFSEDASIFKIKPALVVQPKNSSDIKNLVAYVLKQKKKILLAFALHKLVQKLKMF
jgi:FAD/FMN-containing dehydrogenase